ncbi:MAG: IS982 family transposase [Gammaproteobacteria bacterium]|nr:IS982 family transposase [Gammaproteobacteria bacterium]
MDNITELFCQIDDFCKTFELNLNKHLIPQVKSTRNRATSISLSELMTIAVLFHQLRFRQFKSFYNHYLKPFLYREFPSLPSYNRCVELMPRCLMGLFAFFQTVKASCTGISFIDSTKLAVCHNRRIPRHQVFKNVATRGKGSLGWFFGFKLHLIINHLGGIVSFKLTQGHVNDRQPVDDLCRSLFGILVGDKGYLGAPLKQKLALQNIQLLTPIRQNMKRVEWTPFEKYLLQRRALIETVNDQLKNLCQIEHTRHRSMTGFLVNLMSGLVAYCLNPDKPKLKITRNCLPKAM